MNALTNNNIPPAHPSCPRKILIVDDDTTTLKVIKLYLEDCGYHVVGATTTGKESIDLCRKLKPDLVLMDILLGKGLDGIEAAGLIQANFNTPIVFVTSYADEITLNRAKALEPAGYINKPLRETDIKTTLELVFSRYADITPPKLQTTDIVELLRDVYSLSRSEARVVAKLVEYPDLNYVADTLNISISTARTHLKRIYQKTDTNRQSVLLHKVVTGPVGAVINQNRKNSEQIE